MDYYLSTFAALTDDAGIMRRQAEVLKRVVATRILNLDVRFITQFSLYVGLMTS